MNARRVSLLTSRLSAISKGELPQNACRKDGVKLNLWHLESPLVSAHSASKNET